jgi:predicted SAM-dependent methyltransferase
MKSVLNVGGGTRQIAIPPRYGGWKHVLLDIAPSGDADLVMDARELAARVPAESYDAVYCAHNLEHYHRHDAARVLAGFLHVLRPGGFAEVRVPDLLQLMRIVVDNKLDVDDTIYHTGPNQDVPILVRDVIYGYHVEIERSGQDFYAHKTGFSPKSLGRLLEACGFGMVIIGADVPLEITAFAFKGVVPAEEAEAALGLKLADPAAPQAG